MKTKAKIIWIPFGMLLLVALVAATAVNRQRAAVETSAIREAESMAGVLGLLFPPSSNHLDSSAQDVVSRLHQSLGREVALLDPGRRILADAVPSRVGGVFADGPNGEVAATMRDGRVRSMAAISPEHPDGIEEIVAPVQDGSGRTLGAVVLEDAPLSGGMRRAAQTTLWEVALIVVAGAAAAMLVARRQERSTAAPPPAPGAEEISRLAAALDRMAQTRLQAEESLRRAQEELESRSVERAAELGKASEALRLENSGRQRAERKLSIAYAISRILAESPPWQQAMREVMRCLGGILNWEAGAFWMADHRAGALRCGETWSAPQLEAEEFEAACRRTSFTRGSRLPGTVWVGGQAAWVRDLATEADCPRADAARRAGFRSSFAFPVFIGSGVGGVIEFFRREPSEPDPDLRGVLASIGSQLGQFLERKGVEEHLLQNQRLETVGKLAGGIAHEFNNIMTAILGHSELLLDDLPPDDSLRPSVGEINKAASRAATLTRQLLAYGRRQNLRPAILDLNVILAEMSGMLSHLVGPGVEVTLKQSAGLHPVRADAGQIEQVVVNIAMNAMEAMPNGGKLTLETANVALEAGYVGRLPGLKPGGYVMLAITDTGAGMREEVKARIFEPFFTTKGVGKGTGLGLATCHGIVTQSGGHITVYSEQGRGTTLRIYLPQAAAPAGDPHAQAKAPGLPQGTETILLVEDDPGSREVACWLLRRLGYTVLTAGNGVEAMSVAHQAETGHVDLLFTDLSMPHMSGYELAARVSALFPHTKILFTTAHSMGSIAQQGVMRPGADLLQKPYTPSTLAHKVREILDERSADPALSTH